MSETVKVRVAADLLKANDLIAAQNRARLQEAGVVAVNLMSSPGAGKTTLLEKAIPVLCEQLRVGVIEGDLYTDRDARRLGRLGIPVVQINTAGTCHLDARMVAAVLDDLPLSDLDLLFIENVGNLVCPAGFDLGEQCRVAVLSVAEGSDKPAKYPALFRTASAVVINKIDLLGFTDFDSADLAASLRGVNPDIAVFEVSARTGEGLGEWCRWVARLAPGKGAGMAVQV